MLGFGVFFLFDSVSKRNISLDTPFWYFMYFWLTIQNTANRQVRNLFCLLAVFISFPLARCAPPPHPAPLFFWGGKYQKTPVASGVGAWTSLRWRGRCWRGRGRVVLVALYVQGVWRYRTRSCALRARTRDLGVYECER
jgi:hypothetical protein